MRVRVRVRSVAAPRRRAGAGRAREMLGWAAARAAGPRGCAEPGAHRIGLGLGLGLGLGPSSARPGGSGARWRRRTETPPRGRRRDLVVVRLRDRALAPKPRLLARRSREPLVRLWLQRAGLRRAGSSAAPDLADRSPRARRRPSPARLPLPGSAAGRLAGAGSRPAGRSRSRAGRSRWRLEERGRRYRVACATIRARGVMSARAAVPVASRSQTPPAGREAKRKLQRSTLRCCTTRRVPLV
eukprot:scaffold30517_cov53-Phaeocystis_antarctica.AAC.1